MPGKRAPCLHPLRIWVDWIRKCEAVVFTILLMAAAAPHVVIADCPSLIASITLTHSSLVRLPLHTTKLLTSLLFLKHL